MRMLVPVPFRIRFQTAPWCGLPTLFDATCLFRLGVHTTPSQTHTHTPTRGGCVFPPGSQESLEGGGTWLGRIGTWKGGSRPGLSGGGTVPFEDGRHGQTLLAVLSPHHACVFVCLSPFLSSVTDRKGTHPLLFSTVPIPGGGERERIERKGTSTDPIGKETPFRSTENKSLSLSPSTEPNPRPSASVRRTVRLRIRPCRGGKEETRGRWQGNTTR